MRIRVVARRRRASSIAVCAGILVGLASCRQAIFPRALFTIDAGGADYPVMLSRTPGGPRGHKIIATSGTKAATQSSSYSTGKTTVISTFSQSSESELPAFMKFSAQVGRADKWVQIDGAEFHAEDFAAYGSSSAQRQLTIEGTAFR